MALTRKHYEFQRFGDFLGFSILAPKHCKFKAFWARPDILTAVLTPKSRKHYEYTGFRSVPDRVFTGSKTM